MVPAGPYGLLAGAAAAVVYLLMRRAFVRRLGGMTGDCAGALIEVIEAASLITLTYLGSNISTR
jgi:adenosylcobinamide-GDP ribazoletransferase